MPDQPAPKSASTYAALAHTFDKTQKDQRGFTYISGAQCVTRLNEVLGYDGWSFRIKDHGVDAESDSVWVLGELIVYSEQGISFRTHAGEGTMVGVLTREQFGSQAHNRRSSDGKILDYGFDLKGAATDALKKCATLVGVGLYLSAKEKAGTPSQGGTQDRSPSTPPAEKKASSTNAPSRPAPSQPNLGESGADYEEADADGAYVCSECGVALAAVKRQNGSTMSAQAFAERTRTEFGLPLCAKHYKAKLTAVGADAGQKTPQDAKAPQNGAQPQESAHAEAPPIRAIRDRDTMKLLLGNVRVRYGDFIAGQLRKGYRPPAAKGKQNFYATLSTATGYNRDTVHALLGISVDKETHIEEWLEAADTQLGSLLNILIRHHQNPDDTNIPTLADLA